MQLCDMAKQDEKKQKARSLYLTGQYDQKEIAALVGATEKTISKWKHEEDWEGMKESMLTSRENELKRMYKILANLNEKTLEDIEEGKRVNPKDGDAVIKYTAAIKNLELETSIAEKVEVGMAFINFVRPENVELSKEIAQYFDAFLKQFFK
jgi:uncharacterized protein YjcR